MLFKIQRGKLLQQISLHPVNQQGSPSSHNLLTGTSSYLSMETPIDELHSEKVAQAEFLFAFQHPSFYCVSLPYWGLSILI